MFWSCEVIDSNENIPNFIALKNEFAVRSCCAEFGQFLRQQTKAINSLLHKQTTTVATVEILEHETGSETVIKRRGNGFKQRREDSFLCVAPLTRENEILRNFIKRFSRAMIEETENTFLSCAYLIQKRHNKDFISHIARSFFTKCFKQSVVPFLVWWKCGLRERQTVDEAIWDVELTV